MLSNQEKNLKGCFLERKGPANQPLEWTGPPLTLCYAYTSSLPATQGQRSREVHEHSVYSIPIDLNAKIQPSCIA